MHSKIQQIHKKLLSTMSNAFSLVQSKCTDCAPKFTHTQNSSFLRKWKMKKKKTTVFSLVFTLHFDKTKENFEISSDKMGKKNTVNKTAQIQCAHKGIKIQHTHTSRCSQGNRRSHSGNPTPHRTEISWNTTGNIFTQQAFHFLERSTSVAASNGTKIFFDGIVFF